MYRPMLWDVFRQDCSPGTRESDREGLFSPKWSETDSRYYAANVVQDYGKDKSEYVIGRFDDDSGVKRISAAPRGTNATERR